MNDDSYYSPSSRIPIVEIEMSANQFTELITNMNSGDGVPCTIRQLGKEHIPRPPNQVLERNRIKESFKNRAAQVMEALPDLVDSVRDILEQKTLKKSDKTSILDRIGKIQQEVVSNMPFLLELFDEATDKSITAAKTEVDMFVTNTLVKLGMERIESNLIDTSGDPKALKE